MNGWKEYTFASILFKQYPAFTSVNSDIKLLRTCKAFNGDTYVLLQDKTCNVYFVAVNASIVLVTVNDTLAYNAYDRVVKLYGEGV